MARIAESVVTAFLLQFELPRRGGGARNVDVVKQYASIAETVLPEFLRYTFPAMGVDEAVLLRTYDSACADAGRPFWTPHSAFRDRSVPEAPENHRASVEMRALCVWR